MYKRRICLFFSFILFFPAGLAGAARAIRFWVSWNRRSAANAGRLPSPPTIPPAGLVGLFPAFPPTHPSVEGPPARRQIRKFNYYNYWLLYSYYYYYYYYFYLLLDPAGCRRVGVGVSDVRPICRGRTVGKNMRQNPRLVDFAPILIPYCSCKSLNCLYCVFHNLLLSRLLNSFHFCTVSQALPIARRGAHRITRPHSSNKTRSRRGRSVRVCNRGRPRARVMNRSTAATYAPWRQACLCDRDVCVVCCRHVLSTHVRRPPQTWFVVSFPGREHGDIRQPATDLRYRDGNAPEIKSRTHLP